MSQFEEANKLIRQGKIQEAVILYAEVTEQNPNLYWYYQRLGESLVQINDLDAALIIFRRALGINPNAAWSYYELGKILERQGKLPIAVGFYKRAMEIKPELGKFKKSFESAMNKLVQLNK